MPFLKPLFKTIIISSLLFFVLVFLGMKYHWIGIIQDDKGKNKELIIPHQSKNLDAETSTSNLLSQNQNSDEIFQPQIIQTEKTSTLVNNMTKTLVKESCLQLLRRTIIDSDTLELAVGNCVISNYRDPIIETRMEEGMVKPTQSRQAQTRRNNIIESCQQRIYSENIITNANEVEKQLLLGICVSGKGE